MIESIPSGIYRHYKGGMYEVLTIAKHSEKDEELVIYKSLTNGSVWARPVSMWNEIVTVNGTEVRRFEKQSSDFQT